ncbi:MAG TPA: Holliday junction resolvase RuvX [Myxococcaceae bacterium]|nr:Holliday junction resolvase RuvX [Myxococcaceae bacterium]
MRAMGLDVGTQTVGVAVSDALGLTAQPVTTVRRQNMRVDLGALSAIARAREVTHVVVGLPLNMDGTEGPRAAASRKFGAVVEDALGVPVEYWDERLSTVGATRVLLEADLSRVKRRKVVDRAAAVWILQGWLDARRPPNPR